MNEIFELDSDSQKVEGLYCVFVPDNTFTGSVLKEIGDKVPMSVVIDEIVSDFATALHAGVFDGKKWRGTSLSKAVAQYVIDRVSK